MNNNAFNAKQIHELPMPENHPVFGILFSISLLASISVHFDVQRHFVSKTVYFNRR